MSALHSELKTFLNLYLLLEIGQEKRVHDRH